MTDKVKLADCFSGSTGFGKDLQDLSFAFDSPANNFTLEAGFFSFVGQRAGDNGKLRPAFAVESRVDNDDDVVSPHICEMLPEPAP
jgi:hypothetical protein